MSNMDNTDNPSNAITIAVATEPTTKVFQIGETVAETIARMNLALLPHVANDTP